MYILYVFMFMGSLNNIIMQHGLVQVLMELISLFTICHKNAQTKSSCLFSLHSAMSCHLKSLSIRRQELASVLVSKQHKIFGTLAANCIVSR